MALRFIDFLGDNFLSEVPVSIQWRIEELKDKLARIETKFGQKFVVIEGLRTPQEHYDKHYSMKKLEDKIIAIPNTDPHMTGQAADIEDLDGTLYFWCLANEKLISDLDLYVTSESGLVHFQTVRPRGGHRFF